MNTVKIKSLAEAKAQELLCRKCPWKQNVGGEKFLCLFGRCIYEESMYTVHGANKVCIEYTSRLSKRRVQCYIRIENREAKNSS